MNGVRFFEPPCVYLTIPYMTL